MVLRSWQALLAQCYEIDANKAFVCDNGRDRELSFPKQVVDAVSAGAEFGRCAHIND